MRDYVVSAALVLPTAFAAIEDGAVRVRGGRIVAIGRRRDLIGRSLPHLRLGDLVLLPGLVNAHTHLALSALRGHLPERPGMAGWLRAMRQSVPSLTAAVLRRGYALGVRRLVATGTTAAGDIVPAAALAVARRSPLSGRRFVEALGFDRTFASLGLPRLTRDEGLAPHAPYTTSADIYRAAARLAARTGLRLALHVAESAEEEEFLRRGSGPIRAFREEAGPLPRDFVPPRLSAVAYLDSLGALGPGSLAVHATFATRADIARLARRGVAVALCPRSNLALSGRTADVLALRRAGVALALGTDSLASVPTLSLLDELRALRAVCPSLSPETALDLATRGGAEALAIPAGRLAPGLAADLAAFPAPRGGRSPAEAVLAAKRARFVAVAGVVRLGRPALT